MESCDALKLIDKIDRTMAGKIPMEVIRTDVFKTLDDFNASRQDIEMVGSMISPEILIRLTSIANSIYVGNMRRGDVNSFFDVVNCLGMQRTKALIISLSNYHHGIHDQDVEMVFARSYATSIMAQIIANQCGFRDDAITRAELCGLFLEIGKKVMLLYKKMYAADPEVLDDDFIDSYHPYLGEKIVDRYAMPDYIKSIILARSMIMEEYHISLLGIVHLAYDSVCMSFQKYDNRLLIKCQTPRPATDITRTLEAMLTEKFKAVGLEKYLHIVRIPRFHDI